MKTKIAHTDKSVRDHSQQVILKDDVFTIKSKEGRKTIGSYSFTLIEWETGIKIPSFNINFNIKKFITDRYFKVFTVRTPEEDCLANRIIDSQIYAIQKVIDKIRRSHE